MGLCSRVEPHSRDGKLIENKLPWKLQEYETSTLWACATPKAVSRHGMCQSKLANLIKIKPRLYFRGYFRHVSNRITLKRFRYLKQTDNQTILSIVRHIIRLKQNKTKHKKIPSTTDRDNTQIQTLNSSADAY